MPLIRTDNLITDDRLRGQWENGSTIYHIQKVNESRYRLSANDLKKKNYSPMDSITDQKAYIATYSKNGLDYSWVAGLVKIDQSYYLNLSALECLDNHNEDAYDLEGTFDASNIAKVEWISNDQVNLRFFNGEKIREIILSGRARISYEYDALFGTFSITASSEEMEKFLGKYGNYEGLYDEKRTIHLYRKK